MVIQIYTLTNLYNASVQHEIGLHSKRQKSNILQCTVCVKTKIKNKNKNKKQNKTINQKTNKQTQNKPKYNKTQHISMTIEPHTANQPTVHIML